MGTPLEDALARITAPGGVPAAPGVTPTLGTSQGTTGLTRALESPQVQSAFQSSLGGWEAPKPERQGPSGVIGGTLNALGWAKSGIWSTAKEGIDLFQGEGFSGKDWWNQATTDYGFGNLIHDERQAVGWGLIAASPFTAGVSLALGAGVLADNIWADRVIGFIGDVAVDPLTYMGGMNVITRGMAGAKKARMGLVSMKRLGLNDFDEFARVMGAASDDVARAMLKDVDDAVVAGQKFGSMSGIARSLGKTPTGKLVAKSLGFNPGLRLRVPGTGMVGQALTGNRLSKKLAATLDLDGMARSVKIPEWAFAQRVKNVPKYFTNKYTPARMENAMRVTQDSKRVVSRKWTAEQSNVAKLAQQKIAKETPELADIAGRAVRSAVEFGQDGFNIGRNGARVALGASLFGRADAPMRAARRVVAPAGSPRAAKVREKFGSEWMKPLHDSLDSGDPNKVADAWMQEDYIRSAMGRESLHNGTGTQGREKVGRRFTRLGFESKGDGHLLSDLDEADILRVDADGVTHRLEKNEFYNNLDPRLRNLSDEDLLLLKSELDDARLARQSIYEEEFVNPATGKWDAAARIRAEEGDQYLHRNLTDRMKGEDWFGFDEVETAKGGLRRGEPNSLKSRGWRVRRGPNGEMVGGVHIPDAVANKLRAAGKSVVEEVDDAGNVTHYLSSGVDGAGNPIKFIIQDPRVVNRSVRQQINAQMRALTDEDMFENDWFKLMDHGNARMGKAVRVAHFENRLRNMGVEFDDNWRGAGDVAAGWTPQGPRALPPGRGGPTFVSSTRGGAPALDSPPSVAQWTRELEGQAAVAHAGNDAAFAQAAVSGGVSPAVAADAQVWQSSMRATWDDAAKQADNIAEFNTLPDDALIRAFHGTTPESAARIKEEGVAGFVSRGDLANPDRGFFIAPTRADAARYGGVDGEVVGLVVRKGDMRIPQIGGRMDAGRAFFNSSVGTFIPEGTPLRLAVSPQAKATSPKDPLMDTFRILRLGPAVDDAATTWRQIQGKFIDGVPEAKIMRYRMEEIGEELTALAPDPDEVARGRYRVPQRVNDLVQEADAIAARSAQLVGDLGPQIPLQQAAASTVLGATPVQGYAAINEAFETLTKIVAHNTDSLKNEIAPLIAEQATRINSADGTVSALKNVGKAMLGSEVDSPHAAINKFKSELVAFEEADKVVGHEAFNAGIPTPGQVQGSLASAAEAVGAGLDRVGAEAVLNQSTVNDAARGVGVRDGKNVVEGVADGALQSRNAEALLSDAAQDYEAYDQLRLLDDNDLADSALIESNANARDARLMGGAEAPLEAGGYVADETPGAFMAVPPARDIETAALAIREAFINFGSGPSRGGRVPPGGMPPGGSGVPPGNGGVTGMAGGAPWEPHFQAILDGVALIGDRSQFASRDSVFWNGWDKFQNYLKAGMIATPGFVNRNIMGAFFNAWVDGVSPAEMFKSVGMTRQVWMHANKSADAGKPLSFLNSAKELAKTDASFVNYVGLLERGVRGGGQAVTAVEMQQTIGGLKTLDFVFGQPGKKVRRVTLAPWSSQNVLFKGVRDANGWVEDMIRLGVGMDTLKNGGSLDDALNRIAKSQFDYSELSQFETEWVKRFVPFYTWTRKNVPYQLKQLGAHPYKYNRIMAVKRNLELGTKEEGVVPDYYMEPFGIRMPFSRKGATVYSVPDIPFQDLLKLDPTGSEGASGVLSNLAWQLTPLLKTPIEVATKTNLASGIPFRGNYQQVPKPMTAMKFLMPVLQQIGLAKKSPTDGSWRMRDHHIYAVGNMMPTLGLLRRMWPNEERYQRRQLTTLLSVLGGVNVQFNTPEEQYSWQKSQQYRAKEQRQDFKDLMYPQR
jgi:hypothetical protein